MRIIPYDDLDITKFCLPDTYHGLTQLIVHLQNVQRELDKQGLIGAIDSDFDALSIAGIHFDEDDCK